MLAGFRHTISSGEKINYAVAYLNQAVGLKQDMGENDVGLIGFAEDSASSKMVIRPTTVQNVWMVNHGIVIDVESGDNSSGVIDGTRFASRMVSDSPPWARTFPPTYWDENYIFDEVCEPRMHCIERRDGWDIYLMDRKGVEDAVAMRLVASFPKDNNPNHTGIYEDHSLIPATRRPMPNFSEDEGLILGIGGGLLDGEGWIY